VYTEFFGLNEKPFSISPDPRYLYLSRRHADALAHLIYGISESGGFIQLTGEVGTGKTTLIRSLLEQLPAKAEIALILNPQLSKQEFLESICQELRIPLPAERSAKALIDSLNVQLLRANAQDRRIVLIVDEAQTLSTELLEQVRLLTNLETAKKKLLQIILIGQPELREILERPEMRQVAQRITGRYHLEPLSAQETAVYIKHRMRVAGAHREVFKPAAVRRIYSESSGIPRLINVVADRALLAAYTQERSQIDRRLVRQAAHEVFGKRATRRWWPWAAVTAGIAGLALTTATQYDSPRGDIELPAEVAQSTVTGTPASNPAVDVALPSPTNVEAAEAVVTPAASSVPSQRLAALLVDAAFPTDSISATRALFRLWNATYEPSRGTACSQAVMQDLQCLFLSRGSLGELRTLNRPSILTLVDANGDKHQVVVTRLDYATAELAAEDGNERVDIVELTHFWYGETLLLWKPLLASPEDLAPGSRSESVPWLRDALQRIFGTTMPGDDPLHYDEQLAERVREFQRGHRLTIDGVVGAQTQMAMQTALGEPGIPLLTEAD
jgi:general secretion pathway protein A